MQSKATKSRVCSLAGLGEDNKVRDMKIVCVRKPIPPHQTRQIPRNKKIIAIISNPKLHQTPIKSIIDGWCHPFRNPTTMLPHGKPSLLLSESDFVDPKMVPVLEKSVPRWDFFYFFMGGIRNQRYKNFDLFVECIPILCGKMGLKGIAINYGSKHHKATKSQNKILKQHKNHLRIKYTKLSPGGVARIMSKSKFGFFPNFKDSSPLMLAESLVRNTPVLVYENIMGGWKYVNQNTGEFFNVDNVEDAANKLLNTQYSPKDWFLDNFGFDRSAKKLASWLNENFTSKSYKKACLYQFKNLLR